MDINDFDVREVAQQIKNIRSTYYQKLNNSKKSGASTDDIYQTKVPWFTIVPEMNTTVSNLCDSQVQNSNTLKTPDDEDKEIRLIKTHRIKLLKFYVRQLHKSGYFRIDMFHVHISEKLLIC